MAKKGGAQNSRARKRDVRRAETRQPVASHARPVETASEEQAMTYVARPSTAAPASPYRPNRPVYRRAGQQAAVPTDYSYVRKDLQRIGVLVGIIAVALLALTFALR